MAPRRLLALRYLEEFRCIGGDCEDNCCHQWGVYVDQSAHARLKKTLGKDEPERFARLELLPPDKRNRDAFARIPEASKGDCPMLDDNRLCVIQARYGEDMLPAVCSTYPRQEAEVGGRGEMTGALSCPEMARKALLHEGATELIDAAPALFAPSRRRRVLELTTPYVAQIDEIRGTLYQWLADERWPIASRLYFALTLAERVAGFFHANIETLDGERLRETIAAVEGMREPLHQQLRATQTEAPLAVSVLAQALAARMLTDPSPRMKALLGRVFIEYGVASDGPDSWRLSPVPLAEAYARRWENLRDHADLWLGNYTRHYVFHHWYCDVPTLGVYVQGLALKLALIRFLTAGHPLAETEPQKALVEVVYTLARAIDHSPYFIEALVKVTQEKLGPASTLALLKL
jgi:lysine-N-methylase